MKEINSGHFHAGLPSHLVEEVAKETEKQVLSGINGLIERGILEIRLKSMQFFEDRDHLTGKPRINVAREVEIVSKEHDYIERIEKENAKMKFMINNGLTWEDMKDEITRPI